MFPTSMQLWLIQKYCIQYKQYSYLCDQKYDQRYWIHAIQIQIQKQVSCIVQ